MQLSKVGDSKLSDNLNDSLTHQDESGLVLGGEQLFIYLLIYSFFFLSFLLGEGLGITKVLPFFSVKTTP